MKRTVGVNKKMQKKFTGPWIVVQKGAKNSYKLRHAVTDHPLSHTIHSNRMKPYVEGAEEFYSNVNQAQTQQQQHAQTNERTNIPTDMVKRACDERHVSNNTDRRNDQN